MKNFIHLCFILCATIEANAQTYFDQNFNASNILADYYGKPVTAEKFDAISMVGNSTAEILNHKLRIVKKESSEISRVGLTRKTLFKNMPKEGAKFLKFAMEVTMSDNTKNVPDGFAFFFVKETNNGASAPGQESGRHSFIAIDPGSQEGTFKIRANSKSSGILSGTLTIVSYINNSGKASTYKAPDGTMVTLEDDRLDVWTITKDGLIEHLLTNVPARDPEGVLRNFKIACNKNFEATLTIDNLLLMEEPIFNK